MVLVCAFFVFRAFVFFILQTLMFTLQLNPGGLLTVTSLLKNCILQTQSIIAATNVSGNTRGLNPHILKLAVRVVSNLLSGIPMNKTAPSILNSIIEDSLLAINKLIEVTSVVVLNVLSLPLL